MSCEPGREKKGEREEERRGAKGDQRESELTCLHLYTVPYVPV